MAGRASFVGAAATHVGNVREHNEDSHYFDEELGLFLVCDGMGGHAAGEVASAIAIKTIRERWSDHETQEIADVWLARGTAIAKKQLLDWLREGVVAAHHAIIGEAERDPSKSGMGTTLVAAMVIGSELVFAHAGDSRAYLVRDGIAMQLTEDHTLLQRLLAAGIDVDVSGDGARFRSMLTNALGIGQDLKVSTFVVPLADGDRFMICSDGISEYVPEAEVGEVLTKQPSPARAAQRLVDLALERGGADNATAVVIRVLEAGENPLPAEQRRRDDLAISLCELWTARISPQQRLRAMRIAIAREHAAGERLPPHTFGDRVAWIVVEGEATQYGEPLGPGALIYPESLIAGSQAPDKESLAVARTEVRAVAIRNDDFRELCEEDPELGEALLESLGQIVASREPPPPPSRSIDTPAARASTAPPENVPASSPAPSLIMVTPSALAAADAGDSAIDRAIEMATTAAPPAALAQPAAERNEDSQPEIEVVLATSERERDELELSSMAASASSPEIQVIPVAVTDIVSAPITLPMKIRPPTEPEIEMSIEMSIEMDADGDGTPVERAEADSSGLLQMTVTHDETIAVSGTIENPSKD